MRQAEQLIAYRLTHDAAQQKLLSTNPRILYHDLNPHPALSPVPLSENGSIDKQRQNESEYRQLLVQGALAILLPTEDLENACLRSLVADVIAEVILGNVIGDKACEGWFIWNTINSLIESAKARLHPQTTAEAIKTDAKSRLERFGLLTGKEEKQKTGKRKHRERSSISSVFWRTLQFLYLAVISVRFVVVGFVAASSQPLRSSTIPRVTGPLESSTTEKGPATATRQQIRPLLQFRIFTLVSSLLNLQDRLPWLYGWIVLFRHHLINGALHVATTDGIVDQ